MRSVHKATRCVQNDKLGHFTTSACAIEFERLLKPFKGDVSGGAGGDFSMFQGGTENA